MTADLPQFRACHISIRGVVQGVGFRPFVYRVAARHNISGWVLNADAGVEIHAEAMREAVGAFIEELRGSPPPAAVVSQFDVQHTEPQGFSGFQIRSSRRDATPTVRMAPDMAVCADCLRELNSPSDRRYCYAYINCTNCGPRYSIIHRLPYDRVNTTMAAWDLCDQCRQEYEDPLDRRYHAQPIACEKCGPGYRLIEIEICHNTSQRAIRRAAELLCAGQIVAVKGIGGYHLACDATNAAAVEALRTRKYRKEKPFALMVSSLENARGLVALTDVHQQLLLGVARPIVLAEAKIDLPGVAPDNASLGVMLPYAPLHHLLFQCGAPSPLVLTSANRSSEPIAYRDDDACERLAGIADALLIGERPIARRVDDSVLAVRAGKPFMIRRSRGYTPAPVCQLPASEPVLAVGSDLKNAIALVAGGEVLVSQHIGDLGDLESNTAFEETVRDLLAMYEIQPDQLTVVHDLHPQFYSTRFALAFPARRRIGVQHHHAHIASVLAEHHLLDERVAGVAFDGTGYGTDGTIWGGEFFVGSLRTGFERCGHLRPVQMPGGDAAAQFPPQAAAGFVTEVSDHPDLTQPPFLMPPRFTAAMSLVAKNVRCFSSTSAGRLFDAVAALLGFIRPATFEGQAAIWLEHQARQCPPQAAYALRNFDHRPLFEAIIRDRIAGRSVAEIAASFHAALASEIAAHVSRLCQQNEISIAVVSGGVFQNELLLNSLFDQLQPTGIRVITNQYVPVNDGGICLGQAALAVMKSPPAL